MNCKDANIKLCKVCAYDESLGYRTPAESREIFYYCAIQINKRLFEKAIKENYIKDVLIGLNTLNPHEDAALKLFPEHYDRYKKIMVLR